MESYKMFINGEWVEALNQEYYDDMNPYTGEVFARVANGGAEETKLAVDAAYAALPLWGKTPAAKRRELLLKAADILMTKTQDFSDAMVNECGYAKRFSMQTFVAVEMLREAASMALNVHGTMFPSDMPDCVSMMWRQPIGVVGCISPWNAPLMLGLRSVVFPLACGDTVVFKTSEASSVSGGVLIAQVFEEAGFPPGVVNLVTNGPGKSKEIGDVFTSDPRVRCITFTGSTSAGTQLGVECAKTHTRFCDELGGSDPLIILKDADVDMAVDAAASGRFGHQGQICTSTKRMIVEEPIADEFLQKLVAKTQSLVAGDPRDMQTQIGPLINQTQLDTLVRQVEKAKEEGAQILTGGKVKESLVYEPTVLVMTEDMQIAKEEVFGPVACVIIAKDPEDALRIANDSDYGLSGGVITNDIPLAWDLAERMDTGMCHINDNTMADETHAPLGGVKASGYGRNGFLAVDEFTVTRWVTLQKHPHPYMM